MKPYALTDRRPIAEGFRKMGYAPVRFLVKKNVHPDDISYLSVLFAAVAAVLFAFSKQVDSLLLVAPIFCFFRLWCNMVDGMVAVASGRCSAKGEVINELPDRISDTLIFLGVALSGRADIILTLFVIIGMLFTTYIGVLSKAVGARRQFGGLMGKQQRMFILAAGCVTAFLLPERTAAGLPMTVFDIVNILIAVGLVQTSVVRSRAMFRELRED